MLGHTLLDYELFIYALQDDYGSIQMSTLVVIRQASDVATVEGDLFFPGDLRLHVLEVVRFDQTPPKISRYGYEVWRGNEKLYWYDSQPHPNDPTLAATDPHHPSASSGQVSTFHPTSNATASPRRSFRSPNPIYLS